MVRIGESGHIRSVQFGDAAAAVVEEGNRWESAMNLPAKGPGRYNVVGIVLKCSPNLHPGNQCMSQLW